MNCLPCFNKDDDSDEETEQPAPPKKETRSQPAPSTEDISIPSNVKQYNFRELAVATRNFRQECLIGEGGFGRVFKGKLKSGETVAVKQLDKHGMQGNKEFENAVAAISILQHPNLISLIGYCADGDQRLIVHQYMPMGSLENHLFANDRENKPMDWFTRMKIGAGAAQGLEYLHDTANPAIIFRDLKSSNILLDENYETKLSDFANYKLEAGGRGDKPPASRVMGTYGYSAPEYSSGGELTLKSDIYSFGVVLLELITGRRVIDTNRPNDEQNLVTWAQPIFREPKRFPDLADPRLDKQFPVTGLNQAVGICAMCLQEESSVRPLVGDLVAALSFLSMPQPIPAFSPPPDQKMDHGDGSAASEHQKDSSSDNNTEGDDEDDGDGDDDDCGSEEEGSSYSDTDSADFEQQQQDQQLNATQGKSRKHGFNGTSSSSSSSSKRKVTFKEPNISSRKNASKKVEIHETSPPVM